MAGTGNALIQIFHMKVLSSKGVRLKKPNEPFSYMTHW